METPNHWLRGNNLDSNGHDTPEDIDETGGLIKQLREVELICISEENKNLSQQANLCLQT